MGYSVPRMDLTARVWTFGSGPPALPRLSTPCQLRGVSSTVAVAFNPSFGFTMPMLLCVPEGTDLRDASTLSGKDLIEVPAGSGRTYQVQYVDDIAKGFSNEWRFAIITKVGLWPTPIP